MQPVRIETFYLGCLAHASYMVVSEGEAAVIDPQRDVDIYLAAAQKAGVAIRHVIETHLHADFVSGHHELAARTGADIWLGEGSGATFRHHAARDGDSLQFGQCRLEFLQTPGHTVESACIVMKDLTRSEVPEAVFTGDTLFVGDVGRPDLSPDHTPQELAALLYHSLHEKLLKLPDSVKIYPAHGAGSLCGRQMSSDRSSTIGRERLTNYALQAQTCEDFVHLLTDDLPPRPEYFARDVELNRQGAAPLAELRPLPLLGADEVLRVQAEGAVILDTRPAIEFASAHIPGSIHIGLGGQFASWAARILGLDSRIILLVGEEEARMRLARVGAENVVGYAPLDAGFALDYTPQISALELAVEKERTVIDVREPGEFQAGAIPGAVNIPLSHLAARSAELDHDKLLVVNCKGGYRSSIAASLLRRAGFRDIANLTGGYDAWCLST